jgi:hypothetical protein
MLLDIHVQRKAGLSSAIPGKLIGRKKREAGRRKGGKKKEKGKQRN